MDLSGNNRYELLFIDEDTVTIPAQIPSAVSKRKQVNNIVPATKATTSTTTKKSHNVEKENKSGALNKNEISGKKPINGQINLKSASPVIASNKSRDADGEEPRKVSFKSQNSEIHEQRNNRSNFREGGSQSTDFDNEQRQNRQYRDRDNRGPQRNRDSGYRGGKREFDRQSGSDKTGVKAIDKRNGAGAHNWGSVKQEIDDIDKSAADIDGISAEESLNELSTEQSVVPEEEGIRELTLDEWKAMRGERTKPQYNIRKANEGEDTSQWKKMVVLNRKKDDDSEEEYEYDPSMYPQRVGRLQRIVDIQINFNDGRRGGRGYGKGRGRGLRTGGGSKGFRPEGERQLRPQRNFVDRQQKRPVINAPKVDDERQFPTLS